MARPILTDFDFGSVAKIINLPAGTNPNDPVVVSQLTSALEGLAWKDDVSVATQGNINLSSPGATIDGVTLVSGNRVLVKAQTDSTQNGIYIWTGASTAMTRSYDAAVGSDLNQAVVGVDAGTSGGSSFRQTAVNATLGNTAISFTNFGTVASPASNTAAGIIRIATQAEVNAGTDNTIAITPATISISTWAKLKYATTFGDGSSNTYTITHNLNTSDITPIVYQNTGNLSEVGIDVRHSTSNTVTVSSSGPLTNNGYRIVIIA